MNRPLLATIFFLVACDQGPREGNPKVSPTLAGSGSSIDRSSEGPSAPPKAPAPEPWVPVATYLNPAMSTDATEPRIDRLLESHRIQWVAVGSLGYTLSVPESRAAEARLLLRADARLYGKVNVL